MNDSLDSDDRHSRPPADTVIIKKTGSWNILFSEAEQSLYIVPTDYHPEPLRIHKGELQQIKKAIDSITDAARRKAKASKKKVRDEEKS